MKYGNLFVADIATNEADIANKRTSIIATFACVYLHDLSKSCARHEFRDKEMKNNMLKFAIAVILAGGLLSSCCKEPTVINVINENESNDSINVGNGITGITINGTISADNGCGWIGGTYTLQGNNLTAHVVVSNSNATDLARLFFDDALLLEVFGEQQMEKDFDTIVSQGGHSFRLENGCGSCSYGFNVSVN